MARPDRRNLFECVSAFVLIDAFLWFGRGPHSFPGATACFAAALLAVLIASHRRAGEHWRELGFRLDTFGRTLKLLAPAALGAAAVIALAAFYFDELHFPGFGEWVEKAIELIVLAIVQQYLLLGFFWRRLRMMTNERAAMWWTALVFAVLHTPNPFLMLATFLVGFIACWIYARSPNLVANGLVHGLLSMVTLYSLPRSVTGGLRVGVQYSGSWL